MPTTRIKSKLIFTLVIIIFFITLIFLYQKIYKRNVCQGCNVILISVDTLRADHMGTYGYNKNTTPNIDSWAKSSIQFEKMYTVFPLTAHSFYTLFTGQYRVLKEPSLQTSYPIQINNYINTNVETLQSKLKENGYYNAAFVTNPVVGVLFKNFALNFDLFEFINTSKFADNDPRIYNLTQYDQKELTKKAVEFLDDYSDQKFFLWLHYLNPHHPYNPPKEYVCRLNNNCDVHPSVLEPHDDPSSCLTELTQPELENEKALYDGEILATDEQIGIILRKIKDLNLNRNTIVVFYSDHGEGFDHNIYHHGNALYESAVRIPFIIFLPNELPNKVHALLDNGNVLEGLLDYLGISKSSNSLFRDVIEGRNEKGKDSVYFLTPTNKTNRIGVTDGKYKFIQNNTDYCLYNGFSEELYNLQEDPDENNNLITTHPTISSQLRSALNSYFGNEYKNENTTIGTTSADVKIIESLKNIGY